MSGAMVLIDRLTAKPGMLDRLMALQLDALPRFAAAMEAWQGKRLYRAREAETAILLSGFDSAATCERRRDSPPLAAHRQRFAPLLEPAEAAVYLPAYAAGSL